MLHAEYGGWTNWPVTCTNVDPSFQLHQC